jgi:hypothetical protein
MLLGGACICICLCTLSCHINTGLSPYKKKAHTHVHGWDEAALHSVEFHQLGISEYVSLPPDPIALSPFPSHFMPLFEVSTFAEKMDVGLRLLRERGLARREDRRLLLVLLQPRTPAGPPASAAAAAVAATGARRTRRTVSAFLTHPLHGGRGRPTRPGGRIFFYCLAFF